MPYPTTTPSLTLSPAAPQGAEAARAQAQTDIQNAVRDAVRGVRDGMQGAGGGIAVAPEARVVASPAVIAALNQQIAGERANIDQLTKQLTSGTTDARENVITEQISASQERLTSLQGQLDVALGVRSEAAELQMPAFMPPDVIPPGAIEISIAFFMTIAVVAIGVPLARAFARRMDRRGQMAMAAPAQSNLDPRLDRIEQAIEAIAIEVERVSEGQRFTNRLMGEMRALPAPNPLEQWPQGVKKEGVPVVDRTQR